MRIIANDVSGSNWTAGSNPALSAFTTPSQDRTLSEFAKAFCVGGRWNWQSRLSAEVYAGLLANSAHGRNHKHLNRLLTTSSP